MNINWIKYSVNQPPFDYGDHVIVKYIDGKITVGTGGWLRVTHSVDDWTDLEWIPYTDEAWKCLNEKS